MECVAKSFDELAAEDAAEANRGVRNSMHFRKTAEGCLPSEAFDTMSRNFDDNPANLPILPVISRETLRVANERFGSLSATKVATLRMTRFARQLRR
jgi:hypothetical protein